MPKPFSPPKELTTVTRVFERFCTERDLTLIGAAADRHGAWEWSAVQDADLLRFLTLALSQNSAGTQEEAPNAEIWLDVRRADKWIRKRTARFRLVPVSANGLLSQRLSRSWSRALQIQSREPKQERITTSPITVSPRRPLDTGDPPYETSEPRTLKEIGWRHLQNMNLDDAQAVFERLLEQDPENPFSFNYLALVHQARGNYVLAEQLYRQGLALPDVGPGIHLNFGVLLLESGRIQEADAEVNRAIAWGGEFGHRLVIVALVRYLQNDLDSAARIAEKAVNVLDRRRESPFTLADVEVVAILGDLLSDDGEGAFIRLRDLRQQGRLTPFSMYSLRQATKLLVESEHPPAGLSQIIRELQETG